MGLFVWEDSRPQPDEFGDYYQEYIELVDSSNVIQLLIQQGQKMHALIEQLSPEEAAHRYAEGKWSVKEVIGHLVDTERIMAYRALCISRGENRSLPGYDQEAYVEKANFEDRNIQNLSTEYDTQRNANISLFNSFDEAQIVRTGTANGVTLSVRALAYIIAGHERFHLNSLDEKYGIPTSVNKTQG